MRIAAINRLFESQDEVLTVKEVACATKSSESYVLEMIHTDVLPAFMIGNHFRVMKEDAIICFLEVTVGNYPGIVLSSDIMEQESPPSDTENLSQ